MRYLLIDRIEFLKVNENIQAVKCITLSEDVFSDHFLTDDVLVGHRHCSCVVLWKPVDWSFDCSMKAYQIAPDSWWPGDACSASGTVPGGGMTLCLSWHQ